jgi:hypothetical protein
MNDGSKLAKYNKIAFYSSMQKSPQRPNHTLPSPEFPNIIKVTPVGYNHLTAIEEWTDSNTGSSTVCKPKQVNTITASQHSDGSEMSKSEKLEKGVGEFGKSVSRKTMRAFYKWNETQQMACLHIKREVERGELEKMKPYEWTQVSSPYRKNIS